MKLCKMGDGLTRSRDPVFSLSTPDQQCLRSTTSRWFQTLYFFPGHRLTLSIEGGLKVCRCEYICTRLVQWPPT